MNRFVHATCPNRSYLADSPARNSNMYKRDDFLLYNIVYTDKNCRICGPVKSKTFRYTNEEQFYIICKINDGYQTIHNDIDMSQFDPEQDYLKDEDDLD